MKTSFFRRKVLVFLGFNSTIDTNEMLKHSNTQLAVQYGHSIVAHEPIMVFCENDGNLTRQCYQR